jgi:hypothetical protein
MSEAEFDVAKDGSFSWAWQGQLLVTYAEPGVVPVARFDAWISCIETHDFEYVLGGAGGGASISSNQRRAVMEALGDKQHISVLVDDRLTRGIFTALSWLGLRVRCFAWADMNRAIQYLAMPNVDVDQVAALVLELRKSAEAAAARGR